MPQIIYLREWKCYRCDRVEDGGRERSSIGLIRCECNGLMVVK